MGVIQDGYYYPSAAEYHLGMEGEINWSRGYSNKYHPTIVRLTDGEDDYEGSLLDEKGTDNTDSIQEVLEACVWDRYAEMRVPLLTKEQIEKEGWEFYTKVFADNLSFGGFFDSNKYYLTITEGTFKLEISDELDYTTFWGYCPTINHLRQIMKLLNIK